MAERIAVVGGGVLGMTLAMRLAQQGREVTLYEAADHFGGLADAWQLDDVVWDRHYHVTLLSDMRIRKILQELDLDQAMQWVETKTGFFSDGKLFSVSNTIEFLKFPALKFFDKMRLGLTISYASKINNWRKLEKLTAVDWLQKLSGKRAFQKIWLPLLRSKLGDNYAKASASFIWAIIARMYAARRTGLKKEMFGYLPGGYARMLDRFTQKLTEQGVTLKAGHRIEQVLAQDDGAVELTFANGNVERFDQVVMTMAAGIAAKVCPQLEPWEVERLNNIEYQGIVCASLLLKQPLSPFYVTNITDTWVPFTGVIEMTALVDKAEFGGRNLVYLPKYVPIDDPMFEETDAAIESRFTSALVQMYPKFDPSDILTFKISRVRRVFAITTLNYSQQLPPRQTSVPGVHIINSALINNGTLNVNECVQLAETAAAELPHRSVKAMPIGV
ncbi:NAD(P)/FAD-dependent oxidoreductase [filamentous cyanobacterium LEGE 11480]|uniref:NAD(P)/FAD-dependent oxidoreductase n=1 Tax=Romeriopsis navalis LEGE 11480 TaxID=2777977 RepID=A0A928Z4N2_9CYAN|nr:NAD(P)/FAD-dependent oxidoreductase [Romeriopsis navalis]MBE9031939.1 NAD(P)/FAD-dependent oxidoreductase [Romeriopsis navalis LEGE 11480]